MTAMQIRRITNMGICRIAASETPKYSPRQPPTCARNVSHSSVYFSSNTGNRNDDTDAKTVNTVRFVICIARRDATYVKVRRSHGILSKAHSLSHKTLKSKKFTPVWLQTAVADSAT